MKRLFPVLLLALLLFGSLQNRARAASTPPEKTASGSPGENPNKHATFDPVLTIQLQRDAAMWGEGTVLDVDVGPNLYAYVRQNPWSSFDPLGLYNVGGGLDLRINPNFVSEVKSWGSAIVNTVKSFGQDLKNAAGFLKQLATKPIQTIRASGTGIIQAAKDFNNNVGSYEMYGTMTKEEFLKGGAELASAGVGKMLKGASTLSKVTPDGQTGRQISTQCFLGGTLILVQKDLILIEEIEVGQRVSTSPKDEQESDTSVDPNSWRVFELTMINPDCEDDVYRINLLRPGKWIEGVPKNNEGQVRIDLHEMGVSGWADLVAIKPCPPIQPGKGRVVLMTINHDNTFLYQLNLDSRGPPLKVTGYHPLFSETRNQWVQVYDLKEGERLRTRDGFAKITRKERVHGRFKVYNLEVEADHRYYAGEQRVLAHNTCDDVIKGSGGEGKVYEIPAEELIAEQPYIGKTKQSLKKRMSGDDHKSKTTTGEAPEAKLLADELTDDEMAGVEAIVIDQRGLENLSNKIPGLNPDLPKNNDRLMKGADVMGIDEY